MFTLPILAGLAVVAVVTSFISGIFGMAGGMLLIGFLLLMLPVPVAMVFHGIIQIAANAWRAWLWRHHVRWSVVFQFGSGAATALLFFSFLDFVPDKAVVLMAVGLTPFAELPAVDLPYGRKRALEIATTLAMEPELMLLDEPTQGMGHEDVDRVTELIKRVSEGRTILMVEHNMNVVSSIADKITVLQRGQILAEGPYEDVSKNPQVMEAYMGTADAALEGH